LCAYVWIIALGHGESALQLAWRCHSSQVEQSAGQSRDGDPIDASNLLAQQRATVYSDPGPVYAASAVHRDIDGLARPDAHNVTHRTGTPMTHDAIAR
jgi:hypothetical protein